MNIELFLICCLCRISSKATKESNDDERDEFVSESRSSSTDLENRFVFDCIGDEIVEDCCCIIVNDDIDDASIILFR